MHALQAFQAYKQTGKADRVLPCWDDKVEEVTEDINKNDDDNEWGISVEDDSAPAPAQGNGPAAKHRLLHTRTRTHPHTFPHARTHTHTHTHTRPGCVCASCERLIHVFAIARVAQTLSPKA